MIYWYRELYMDEKVAKNPGKCKKRVAKRRPWKRSYVAIVLASNEKNLFDIMETRQLFFRRYAYMDMYVVGLASNRESANSLLQNIIAEMWKENTHIRPCQYFAKNLFTDKIK